MMEPRSEEERFERWKEQLHGYLQAPSPGRQRKGGVNAAHPRTIVDALEEKQGLVASAAAEGSTYATPAGSVHASPARLRPSTAAATRGGNSTTTAAAGGVPHSVVARNLASLHKKVRANGHTAGGGGGSSSISTHHHPPVAADGRAFERMSQGLPAHPLGSTGSATAGTAAAVDPRHSLENIEAAFIAKLHAWAPGPIAATAATTTTAAATAVDEQPRGKQRRTASSGAVLPVSSSVASEEEQLRERARQLSSDMAALAHKKRIAALAEAAAALRIQARLQLERAEGDLRGQLEARMASFRDARDSELARCTQLQADLRAQMAALSAAEAAVSSRAAALEAAHAEALKELRDDYALAMDRLHDQAANQMENKLAQLQLRKDGGAQEAEGRA
jgi:hypothetical protein